MSDYSGPIGPIISIGKNIYLGNICIAMWRDGKDVKWIFAIETNNDGKGNSEYLFLSHAFSQEHNRIKEIITDTLTAEDFVKIGKTTARMEEALFYLRRIKGLNDVHN